MRDELRVLRTFVGEDLSNLLGVVERTMLLDIELAAKPGSSIHHARRNLDAFADAAATFMQAAQRVDLDAFLGWLETAESEEGGLEMTPVESNPDAVALLTVHASKGLEWDVVFVPGMNAGAFPSARADRWSTGAKSLPWPLRGDRDDLPEWDTERAGPEVLDGQRETLRRRRPAARRGRGTPAGLCGLHPCPRLPHVLHHGVGQREETAGAVAPSLRAAPADRGRPAQRPRSWEWLDDPEEDAENPVSAGAESAHWPYDPLNGPDIVGRAGVAAAGGPAGERRTLGGRSPGALDALSWPVSGHDPAED